ncbi:MAG: histidinol dehydrogenase [Anaerolineae bacterium]
MMSTTPKTRLLTGFEATRAFIEARPLLDEYEATPALRASIERLFGEALTPDQVVERILRDVRAQGDEAVRGYAELIEGAALDELRVPEGRIEQAWKNTPTGLRDALQVCADRIRAFHEKQPVTSWLDWDETGSALGQMILPLERVGIYAPNGRAPYPSSLLMAAIPAQVAGVREVVVATPPRGGELSDVILAAAHIAGVREVYPLGGAVAIGALAYGTASIPRVDKILGPGNLFVVLAKRRVYGVVGIDQLPGPTETLLLADESADPAWVAADMLAQAEHDPMATAMLITTSQDLAAAARQELGKQMRALSRREVIAESLASRGAIAVVDSLDEAIELANLFAPEHLCLLLRDPWQWVGKVRNAGGIFVGEYTSEALGDYVVGPTHVMPTGRTARFSSPLQVWDFVKITSVFGLSAAQARDLTEPAVTVAEAEGLTAHAAAMRQRLQEDERP